MPRTATPAPATTGDGGSDGDDHDGGRSGCRRPHDADRGRLRRPRAVPAHARADRGAVLPRRPTSSAATSPRAGRATRCGSGSRWSTPSASPSPAPWSTCGTPTRWATTRPSSTARMPTRRARAPRSCGARRWPNDEGIVEFATVYPGWYPGRAVHVHVKAHLDGATVLTSQLYFPEDLTDEVHAEGPYADHGTRDTRNEDDGIAGDPASAGNLRHRVGRRRRARWAWWCWASTRRPPDGRPVSGRSCGGRRPRGRRCRRRRRPAAGWRSGTAPS